MDDVSEKDCCGNGCANCILNTKPTKSYNQDKNGKENILEKYTKFLLINKSLHLPQVEDVLELHFQSKFINNKDYILDIDAGYHLMMRRFLMENETAKTSERKYLLRPYSPFWWNAMEMEFKILVKLIANGPMSEYIKTLEINDEVEFRGPIGRFEHQVDEKGHTSLLIISQGVAVAPVIAIIEQILNNVDDMTRIVHIACFQNLSRVYFREKLFDFRKYWNYKGHIFLSSELCGNIDCINNSKCLETCHNFKSKLKYKETIKPYRLTENELIKIVENLVNTKFIAISGNGKFQNHFKILCQTINCGLQNNNIYLL